MRKLVIIMFAVVSICMLSTCKKDEPEQEPLELVNLSIKVAPSRLDYYVGDSLNLAGLIVVKKMSDGTNIEVGFTDFDANKINCKPENGTILSEGSHLILLSDAESDISANFVVSAQKVVVSSIVVETSPLKLDYYDGDTLNLDGLKIALMMNNGEQEQIDYGEFASNNISCTPQNGSVLSPENEFLTIKHINTGVGTTQEISVIEIELSSIIIKSSPDIIEFFEGDTLNLEGLEITLVMNNGDTMDVPLEVFTEKGIVCTPGQGIVLGTEIDKITITFGDPEIYASQDINVKAVVAENIEITNRPSQIHYVADETLDLSGMVVTISKNNGEMEDIAFSSFEEKGVVCSPSNGATLNIGLNTVTIEYSDISTTMNVSMTEGVNDIDGNFYRTVLIGKQTWMAENLKTTRYNNGDQIDYVEGAFDWYVLTSGAYCWYDNDKATNKDIYGALYNWYVCETEKICPEGWHVSTESEWTELEEYLEANDYNCTDSSTYAVSIASQTGWAEASRGIGSLLCSEKRNCTGLSLVPSGIRLGESVNPSRYSSITTQGNWWVAPGTAGSSPFKCSLVYFNSALSGGTTAKERGLSVRCVKD